MSEPLSYARVQIVQGDVSLYLDAPAGRVTTLNLSALDRPFAKPAAPKRGRMRLVAAALAGCLVGGGVALAWIRPSPSLTAVSGRSGEWPAVPVPGDSFVPPAPPPSAAPVSSPSALPPAAPAGNDPFGLRLK